MEKRQLPYKPTLTYHNTNIINSTFQYHDLSVKKLMCIINNIRQKNQKNIKKTLQTVDLIAC